MYSSKQMRITSEISGRDILTCEQILFCLPEAVTKEESMRDCVYTCKCMVVEKPGMTESNQCLCSNVAVIRHATT
jgi:hypothetical protein